MKACNKCHQEKPEECFGKNKSTYDGLDHYCKECRREYRNSHKQDIQQAKAKYRTSHRQEINAKKREKYEPNPIVRKTEEEKQTYRREYYRANADKIKRYQAGYRAAHIDETKMTQKVWRAKNRDRVNARKKQWRKDNPEQWKTQHKAAKYKRRARVKEQGGSYSLAQLHECLEFFGHCCAYSGEPLLPGYHIDHVQPIAKGGRNVIHNIVPACPAANTSKQDRDWETWYINSPYFSQRRYERILLWIKKP